MNVKIANKYALLLANLDVDFEIEIDGFEYPIQFSYSSVNSSIRIIEPQFTSENS